MLARLGAEPLADRIHLLEPQGYLDFVAVQAGAAYVLTDSGGIQEETTVLGVPCLTLRDNTERPITISEGTNRLVGRNPAAVLTAYHEVRANPPPARRPELWDGKACLRCAEAISTVLGDATLAPPHQLLSSTVMPGNDVVRGALEIVRITNGRAPGSANPSAT